MSSEYRQRAADFLDPPELAEDPLPLRRPAVFGVLVVLMLFGSAIVSASIIARPATGPRPVAPAERIDGVLALRPDLVRAAGWPFPANGGFADAAHADSETDHPAAAVRGGVVNPSAGSSGSALNVVTDFYRRLEHNPSTAVSLLTPGLLGGQRDELVQAWRDVESVRSQARSLPDGSVQADVEARYPDGSRVVLQQELRVEPGTYPGIAHAELLSARHIFAP